MRNIIFLLVIITSFNCYSQEIKLVKFESSSCEEEKMIEKKILSKKQVKDTLIIKIATLRNCCGSVSSSVDFKEMPTGKDILNIQYEHYVSNPCMCMCYYEYEYTIEGLEDDNYLVYINNEEVKQ